MAREIVEGPRDKARAAQCPDCGRFMDKVEALVVEQISGGTIPISKSMDETMVSWVCPNKKCRQVPDKA